MSGTFPPHHSAWEVLLPKTDLGVSVLDTALTPGVREQYLGEQGISQGLV